MCTAYLNRTDFAALFRFEPHFQSLAVTNGNWVLTLFSPSADWLGREGRKAAERHWEGLLTGRHTWAWGEMDDLVSRDSSLGLRRLCPCTFLLTPTWSPTAQDQRRRKGHLPDVLQPTQTHSDQCTWQKPALTVLGMNSWMNCYFPTVFTLALLQQSIHN